MKNSQRILLFEDDQVDVITIGRILGELNAGDQKDVIVDKEKSSIGMKPGNISKSNLIILSCMRLSTGTAPLGL